MGVRKKKKKHTVSERRVKKGKGGKELVTSIAAGLVTLLSRSQLESRLPCSVHCGT